MYVGPFPWNFSIHAFFQRNQIRQKDEYDNLSLKHRVALIYFDQPFPFFVLLSENERHTKMFWFGLVNFCLLDQAHNIFNKKTISHIPWSIFAFDFYLETGIGCLPTKQLVLNKTTNSFL